MDSKRPFFRSSSGHICMSPEFFTALGLARFNPVQFFLIQCAIKLSAPLPPDSNTRPFRFNFTDVARLFGGERSWITKQFHRLVKMNVFYEIDNNHFLIVDNHFLWRDIRGVPLLSLDQADWCDSIAL
jgi:hypothetical protein